MKTVKSVSSHGQAGS